MDSFVSKVRQYVIFLKESGNFTWEDIEKLSGESSSTLRKFCSGKTEKMNFDVLQKIISALGGNFNDALSYTEQKEAEVNSVITLKESYEQQIKALTESFEARLKDMYNSCETRIDDIEKACEARVNDIVKSCELRIADTRQNYEERLNEHKKLLLKLNPNLATLL
jgi:DNA-binding Xre family transcriptional regulator